MFKILIAIIVILLLAGSAVSWYYFAPKKERPDFKRKRILCLGDSITFGAGVIRRRSQESYPAILQSLVPKDYQVLNYGISGATSSHHSDQPYKESFMKAAIEASPDILIFMLGTNDSKPQNWNAEEYEKSLHQRLEPFIKKQTRIYVMTCPHAYSVDGKPIVFDISDEVIETGITPIIRRYAKEKDLGLIDLLSETEGHEDWFMDGVHPNKTGNENIAHCIFDQLKNDGCF